MLWLTNKNTVVNNFIASLKRPDLKSCNCFVKPETTHNV